MIEHSLDITWCLGSCSISDLNIRFNRYRAAYDKLASFYRDIKQLEQALSNKDLKRFPGYGIGFHSCQNAILQYVTDNFKGEDLVNQLQIKYSDLEMKASHDDIKKFVEYIEIEFKVRLSLFLIEVDYEAGSIEMAEVMLSDGRPVVILKEEERFISFLVEVAFSGDEDMTSLHDNESNTLISYDSTEEPKIISIIPKYTETGRSQSSIELYESTLESFKRHLLDISNPLLLQTIQSTLHALQETAFEVLLSNLFKDIFIPPETREFISSIDSIISQLITLDNINTFNLKIRWMHDLRQLAAHIVPQDTIWEELRIFLSLPQILSLSNGIIKKILYTIHQGYIENLRDLVEYSLKSQGFDPSDIDEMLADSEYIDLATLLAQVVNEKPVLREDLVTNWNKPADFFINKTLYFQQYFSNQTLVGDIIQCTRTNKEILLELRDETIIGIYRRSGMYTADIRLKHFYSLWTAITRGLLYNKYFEVRIAKGCNTITKSMIQPGVYRLTLKKSIWGATTLLLGNKMKELVYHITPQDSKSVLLDVYVSSGNDSRRHIAKILSEDLNKSYLAVLEEDKRVECDPSWQVFIKDEKIEEDNQRYFNEEILKYEKQVILELNQESASGLMNDLLDSLIRNKLNSISLDILLSNNRGDIYDIIANISRLYYVNFHSERSPSDILRKIVIQVNYANLVNKSQSVEVYKFVEMLRDVYQHAESLDNKDIVMFIGNTGSGKSTAINYLLGADVDYFINKAGDKAVRVKQTTHQTTLPKIGQALTESETIYVQGYAPPSNLSLPESIMLADCPGFNDTRGGHYELCTSLSIDQAIEKARSIKSLVLTVPIQAFTIDRGNLIIELIENVKESFRNSFDPDYPKLSEAIFILVTKSGQVHPEVVERIKNGARFEELCNESEERMRSLSSRESLNYFQTDRVVKRYETWKFLTILHKNKHIDIVDIRNKIQRKSLLKKYCRSDIYLDKSIYQPFFKSREMQFEFSKYLEMYTHTWSDLILNEYFESIPSMIQTTQAQLTNITQSIRNIENLQESIKLSGIDLKETLNTTSSALVDESCSDGLWNQREHLTIIEEVLDRASTCLLESLQTSLEQKLHMHQDKVRLSQKIKELKKNISKLTSKSCNQILYEKDYRDKLNDYLVLSKISEVDELFIETPDSQDQTLEHVKVADFKGKLVCKVKLERKYSLYTDIPDIKYSLDSKPADSTHKARIDGEGIIQFMRSDIPGSKYIDYLFHLRFDGKKIPWIQISIKIASTDYYESTLLNHLSHINRLQESQGIIHDTLTHNFKQYKQLNRSKASILDHIKLFKSNIHTNPGDIDGYNLNSIIMTVLEILQTYKESEMKKLEELSKRKRKLAIVIKSQAEIVKLIRGIIDFNTSWAESYERTESFSQACSKFVEAYDKYASREIDEFNYFTLW